MTRNMIAIGQIGQKNAVMHMNCMRGFYRRAREGLARANKDFPQLRGYYLKQCSVSRRELKSAIKGVERKMALNKNMRMRYARQAA